MVDPDLRKAFPSQNCRENKWNLPGLRCLIYMHHFYLASKKQLVISPSRKQSRILLADKFRTLTHLPSEFFWLVTTKYTQWIVKEVSFGICYALCLLNTLTRRRPVLEDFLNKSHNSTVRAPFLNLTNRVCGIKIKASSGQNKCMVEHRLSNMSWDC